MDYLKKIDLIIFLIKETGNHSLAEKILDVKKSASTSSELLMSVTYELLMAINTNRELAKTIMNDVMELKAYCDSIGLHVKIE